MRQTSATTKDNVRARQPCASAGRLGGNRATGKRACRLLLNLSPFDPDGVSRPAARATRRQKKKKKKMSGQSTADRPSGSDAAVRRSLGVAPLVPRAVATVPDAVRVRRRRRRRCPYATIAYAHRGRRRWRRRATDMLLAPSFAVRVCFHAELYITRARPSPAQALDDISGGNTLRRPQLGKTLLVQQAPTPSRESKLIRFRQHEDRRRGMLCLVILHSFLWNSPLSLLLLCHSLF